MSEDDPNGLVIHFEGGIDKADKLKELSFLVEKAEENVHTALAHNTRRAYASQWNQFCAWCDSMGLPNFPVTDKVLLIYLTHRVEKGASLSTVTQAYAAIREQHRMKDKDPPTLDGRLYRSWTGARKKASQEHEVEKALALSPADLKLSTAADTGRLAPRDRALLLIGWCSAMRSDEITNLNIEDISVEAEGLRIKIRTSKTDQMGAGHEVGVARSEKGSSSCPVEAWVDYLGAKERPETAPAFVSKSNRRLSNRDIGRILKRRMKRAGLDPEGYSAHSLRAGCITAAAQAGHPLEAIQRQSRHKSLEVLLGYIRTATLLTDNVTKGLL